MQYREIDSLLSRCASRLVKTWRFLDESATPAAAYQQATFEINEAAQVRRLYRTLSSLIAIAESCAGSWTPVCAILMIFVAIISVRGSSRSLTQRVCNACSYASMMQLTSFGPSP